MPLTLKELKAKGLAEKKKEVATDCINVESVFSRQLKEASLHPQIIKQARQSGVLNLSNRGIAEMPDIVWTITNLTAEETKQLSVSLECNDNSKWWEYVDLTKLVLASNALKSISPEISNYPKLSVLDLHDNCLLSLPTSVKELIHLSKLNISRNQFETLPDCIFELKSLKILQVQNNKLKSVHDDIGNLSCLEELDLSHNMVKKLPHCIGFLSRVTDFNVSNNQLGCLPVEIGDLAAMKHFDVSKNKLQSLPDSMETLFHLEQLYVQHNDLTGLPNLSRCTSLKEIHAGYNEISALTSQFFDGILGIKILDLRDNKIAEIPDNICTLQALERFDLSNNALSNLPYTLGTLPHLKFLALEGNPLRCIRRDIIQRGTVQLLRWLRSRIEDPSIVKRLSSSEVDGSKDDSSSCGVDKFSLKSTKALSLSNKNISAVPKELIESAASAEITSMDLSKNHIQQLQDDLQILLPKLSELNCGNNKLTSLPAFIGTAQNLQFLDLRNNQLQSLPPEVSGLSQLREINICYNRLHLLPKDLYQLKKLEIILSSDNQIEEIDAAGLASLPHLAVLDLHNNSIKSVPPELGNITQLRSLLLDGNLFRNPRPAILSRGTPALLEFLRSRISQ